MKKMILSAFILSFALLFSSVSAYAAEKNPFDASETMEESIFYFDDGSRLIISPVYETDAGASIKTAANSVTKSRDARVEDSNGNLECIYTLTASFTYTYGVSSSCTSASYSKTIYDSAWTFSNGSAEKSGNTAYGKGQFTKKMLGITIKNYDVNISLSCDAYGNVT